jgi:hypothetical protein
MILKSVLHVNFAINLNDKETQIHGANERLEVIDNLTKHKHRS